MTDLPAAGPTESRTAARRGSLVLAATGVLFALYPAVRPYSDESIVRGAEAMASNAWVASHLFAMIGFILLPLGLLGLHGQLGSPAAQRGARGAVVVTWLGAGLTLPYYGAETFALNAVGRQVAQGDDPALLGLAAAIRFGPTQAVMFAAGLLLLALGTVLAAVAIWRSGTLPRWSGVPLAVGFGLFFPQFYTAPPIRMAHGLLVAVGCGCVAFVVWRRSDSGLQLGGVGR